MMYIYIYIGMLYEGNLEASSPAVKQEKHII